MLKSPPKELSAAAMAALDELLAEPAAAAKPSRKPATKKPTTKNLAAALPLPKAFAQRKTGYVTWTARARVVVLQRQECRCCGQVTETVKDELFALTNGASKSVWYRHEGYGIIPDDLPIEIEKDPEVKMVSACGQCSDLDIELAIAISRQMELAL